MGETLGLEASLSHWETTSQLASRTDTIDITKTLTRVVLGKARGHHHRIHASRVHRNRPCAMGKALRLVLGHDVLLWRAHL